MPVKLPDISRALAMNIDAIVESDITRQYFADFDGKCIAGANEKAVFEIPMQLSEKEYSDQEGIDYPTFHDEYINAGVVFMDITRVKNEFPNYINDLSNLLSRLIDFQKPFFADQPLCNIQFYKKKKILSREYNLQLWKPQDNVEISERIEHNRQLIWHGITAKPWELRRTTPLGKHYRELCRQTERIMGEKLKFRLLRRFEGDEPLLKRIVRGLKPTWWYAKYFKKHPGAFDNI
jgi:lipopolysaccharide biosynthesis glycosyltransferase